MKVHLWLEHGRAGLLVAWIVTPGDPMDSSLGAWGGSFESVTAARAAATEAADAWTKVRARDGLPATDLEIRLLDVEEAGPAEKPGQKAFDLRSSGVVFKGW